MPDSIDLDQMKRHYEFREEDVGRIVELRDELQGYADEFADAFHQRIISYHKGLRFFKDTAMMQRQKQKVRDWYFNLFNGTYDNSYFSTMKRVGEVHVRIGLPTHYVNAAINFVRRFVNDKIDKAVGCAPARTEYIGSFGKLLDMNLDMMTAAYRAEEMQAFEGISRFKRVLLRFARKSADLMDFTLLGALIISSFFIIALFAYDIFLLIAGEVGFAEGIIMVLGSLLVLWAVSELIGEHIKYLKGEGFFLGAFIGLALAAMIRKILVASLSSEKIVDLMAYGAIVLSLGIVYWLITKREMPRNKE